MGSGPKRKIKDIPLMIPKSSRGQGGRPEYEQLKECPDSFKVNLPISSFAKQLKEEVRVSLSVINEKNIKVMIGSYPLGNLSEAQAKRIFKCIRLGIKYLGVFRKRKTKRGLRIYAEFKRTY